MSRRPPTERPLPNPDRILHRVLSDGRAESHPVRRRPGWLVPAIAATAVAAVVTAAVLVPPALRSGSPDVQPAATPTQPAEIDIDLGPLTQAETATFLKHCWFWNGTAQKTLHATKIKSAAGETEWTVAMLGRSDGGNGVTAGGNRITGCSGQLNGVTDGTPGAQGFRMENFIATVGKMRYDDSFRADEGVILIRQRGKVFSSTWVRVPSSVQRARQRIVDGSEAGPWYSSRALDGLVYVQATIDKNVAPDEDLRLETQFLDASGQPVRIPGSNGLTSSQPISGMQTPR